MSRFKEPAQLHNHSKYSLLDAVPSTEEWVHWCLENDTPGFAVTDHGTAISMFDAIRFPKYIQSYNKKHGTDYPLDKVIGIPAVELYVIYEPGDSKHYHITVWATSNEGYFNLSKLSSIAFDDTVTRFGNIKARVTFDQLVEYKEGLKIGTGCIAGPIGQAIMSEDNYELAEKRFIDYMDMFGDALYIEFHPTDITHDFNRKTGGFERRHASECDCDANAQLAYNKFLKDMVDKHGGKPIPVTDAHFINPEDKVIQDCLLKNGNDNGWYFYESYHQKRAEEMYEFLADQLGRDWLTEDRFKQWIENTYEVMDAAKNINIEFDFHLPKVEIPQHIVDKTDDYNMQTYYYTIEKCIQHGRWIDKPEYKERLKKEIDVIMNNDTLNFLPYFLLYEDIGTYARSLGILQGIGRGSAGGCLLSYYLKIIHIDPIKTGLPFERFLSHARIRAGSFPDIDADFGNRTEIISYLKEKYGLGFAQVATFSRMKLKSAIYDAMSSIYNSNRNHPLVTEITKEIPDSPQGIDEKDFLYGYVDKEGVHHQGLLDQNKKLAKFFDTYPDVQKLVDKLIGVARGLGRHASAYVISTLDLASTRVPTMKMKDSKTGELLTVTQFDAKMVEANGLVKADILGVSTIDAVAKCIDQIKEIDYRAEDENGIAGVYRLPEDKDIYVDFYQKKTDSSFQFGTPIIKGYVQEFCPLSKQDLSDFTALCRPGAMDAPIVNKDLNESDGVSATQYYMDVRNKKRSLSYVHDDLEPYTTNGAFVYQEQIMKFLVDFVGYSLEESDRVRDAIAKKKREVMLEAFARVRLSAQAKGWSDRQIETVNKQIEAFSRYSFNKSHSRCYAELGYITMYLKNKHPLQWWSAILNTENKEDKIRYFMTLLGDKIASPSILNASSEFKVSDGKIIAPLSAVKGLGAKAMEELEEKAPFTDLKDLLTRTEGRRFNKGHFSALAAAGALSPFYDENLSLFEARKQMLDTYESIKPKSKTKFKPELYSEDPLDMFFLEKSHNKCFNKTLLETELMVNKIMDMWPGLNRTGRYGVPMTIGNVPVLRNIAVAKGLIKKEHKQEVGMIVLFKSSSCRSGVSAKGRKWEKRSTVFSDGFFNIEATEWNENIPILAKENTVYFIKGKLSEWNDQPQMQITSMEVIQRG